MCSRAKEIEIFCYNFIIQNFSGHFTSVFNVIPIDTGAPYQLFHNYDKNFLTQGDDAKNFL